MKELPLGKATRDAYGRALLALGKTHPNIIVLDADLSGSTRTKMFAKEFPDRFINVGIAEANMVGIASGLTSCGKTVFTSSFASFLTAKAYDQIRMGVAYSELPVKIVTSHGGITLGEDGVSQMSAEDISLMAGLPHMTVIVPADEASTEALVTQMADIPRPIYLRTGRMPSKIVYEDSNFTIGKARVVEDGDDVAIIACGIMVAEAVIAADELAKDGINAAVIDMHTIKPLDEKVIKEYAEKCGAIVTAEEHQNWCGLGSAVAQAVCRTHPVPMEVVAVQDTFAESGKPQQLLEKYGLTAKEVIAAVKKVVARK